MDLIQLGARMRQEREARKLSLADVMEATKISRRILMAFENGEVEAFPHPVYAKGFVKNYAKLLGLDPLECVRVLEREYCPDESGDEKRESAGISLKDLKDPSGRSLASGRRPWGVVVAVLLLVALLAGLIWYMSESGREQKKLHEPAPAAVEESAPAAEQPEPAAPEAAPAEQAAPQPQAPQPAGKVEASAGVVGGAEIPAVQEEKPVTEQHVLVVSVKGENPCWMGVFRKEAEPGETQWRDEFMVQPGQDLRYEFKGQRTFRFGRLETVNLELDGKTRPASGSGVVDVTLP